MRGAIMPTPLSARLLPSALALLVLAAAPAVQAQAQPRWQVEVSLDQTGSQSMHGVIADGPAGGSELSQVEAVRYSVGASRLARVAARTSLRFGLLLANKGYTERHSENGGDPSNRHVDLLYLGAPITVGYNLVNPHRGLAPFVEAGVVPELLLREDESAFDFDLRRTGLSYLVNLGVKYNLESGRALVLAPEARFAARECSGGAPGSREFRPITVGIKLGVQF
jgi:hypothetical protein